MTIRKLYENSWIKNRQIAEISSEFNQQINLTLPDSVKESCKRVTAYYMAGGRDIKDFAAVLDMVIPEVVRERVNQLRAERHMRIKAILYRNYIRVSVIAKYGAGHLTSLENR